MLCFELASSITEENHIRQSLCRCVCSTSRRYLWDLSVSWLHRELLTSEGIGFDGRMFSCAAEMETNREKFDDVMPARAGTVSGQDQAGRADEWLIWCVGKASCGCLNTTLHRLLNILLNILFFNTRCIQHNQYSIYILSTDQPLNLKLFMLSQPLYSDTEMYVCLCVCVCQTDCFAPSAPSPAVVHYCDLVVMMGSVPPSLPPSRTLT